ncbi:MAG: hypothetical protein GXO73_06190, partial [Calditrichaeota bacterium]|nr:hypothetical protein [Calditrichota bacterium]
PDVEQQSDSVRVDSSGTWRWSSPNFLLAVRHVDDETLNKRFPEVSFRGSKSANPFTYGNWVDPELGYVPPRFTVFEVAMFTTVLPAGSGLMSRAPTSRPTVGTP